MPYGLRWTQRRAWSAHGNDSRSLRRFEGRFTKLFSEIRQKRDQTRFRTMVTVASYHVPGFGRVDVVEQNDGDDRFWDLFASSGECLNEGDSFWRKPTRREVEEFLAPQLKEVLGRLEKECERNQIAQEELDEAVHDAAQTNNAGLNQMAEVRQQEQLISTAEQQAAQINNGGRACQLAYLFEVYGEATTVQMLLKAKG